MSEDEDQKARERLKRLVSGTTADGSDKARPIELTDEDIKETLDRHLKGTKKPKSRKTAASSAVSLGEFIIQSEEDF